MTRWCIVLVVALLAACADDDSGSGDPAFGNATMTVDGTAQHMYAWAFPMRGAQLDMTERNLGWTITFTETPAAACTIYSAPKPPLYLEVWTTQTLPDAVDGTATLETDRDLNIAAGIVSFPSGNYGEGFYGIMDIDGKLRFSAFSPTVMSGTLHDAIAYDDTQRMPTLHPLDVTFEAHACP
ncbi:MAG TPA: hypothetical protein VL326_38640 [Kofleriaceae bacterium]|nr:hypothetical protein [Kofleriaceae bacterium]